METECQEIVHELWHKGMSLTSIAAAIGRSDRQIRKIFHCKGDGNTTTLYRLRLLQALPSLSMRKQRGMYQAG